ncbi:MAG TPA: O-antigen ligase family protein [Solirubrobacterales bacterium]|nr:O-antigen ligase family protein [Solirubrobacterales bacterium]
MSDVLSGAGLLVAAVCAAASILLPAGRPRSAAMLTALVLFPVLILGDQWHNHQIVELRHHEARAVAAILVGIVLVAALAWVFRRWPVLMPLSIIGTLPFRIPIESGGESANLLVPLYVVIAAGVVAAMFLPPPAARRRPRWVAKTLAIFVVLYALQTLYSEDYSKGLQEVCFFLVPFTLAYILLRELPWDRRLLVWALVLVTGEAIAFVLIGSVEYASRSLFWNQAVIRSNEFHTYFRVNSIFWDPNIYGRYLALVLVVVSTAMLWIRARRPFWLLCGAILVLWIGLAQTFSQSSFIALLAGLAVLAALRWSWRWTLAVAVVGIVGAALVVLLAGGSHKLTADRLNVDLSGRGNLISGGAELFSERPLWGYGSGSFQKAYENHLETKKKAPVTISHTEPVTVGAEQGLIGLAAYVALVVVSLWTMGAGLWARGPDRDPPHVFIARAAILAAFVALLVHTMAYAGFFQDPITWVLMAIGASLAASHRRISASSVARVQSTPRSLRP